MTPPGTDNPAPKDTTEGNLQAEIDALLNDVAKSTERIEHGLGEMPGVGTPLESDAETAKLAEAVNGLLAEKPAAAKPKPEALSAIENLDAQLAELTAQLLDHSKPPPAPPVLSDVEAAQAVVNQGAPAKAPVPSAEPPSADPLPKAPPPPQPISPPVFEGVVTKPSASVPPPIATTKATPSEPAPAAEGAASTPPPPTAASPISAPAASASAVAPVAAASKAPTPPVPAPHAVPEPIAAHAAAVPVGAPAVPTQPQAATSAAPEAVTTAESAALIEPIATEAGPSKLLIVMAAMSKPLEGKSRSTKSIIGLLGVFTVVLGVSVWGFVILRPPPKVTETAPFDLKEGVLPRPVEPKAEEEKPAAKGGHEAPSNGHDAPKAKAKAPAKKEAPKKEAPKKAEHAEGGGH